MESHVLRQKSRFQISYELPHEAYDSRVYPRKSANGSTIIIYGHESGVRVVWYGGRSFKSPQAQQVEPKTNGTAKSDPMVIDLDDDDDDHHHNQKAPSTAHRPVGPSEFEDVEDEVDPAAPYSHILRFIDIPLGSAALRVTVPHLPKDMHQIAPDSWPPIYLDRIVIAVACRDMSIRIISLPLAPPRPADNDPSLLSIETLKILGPNSHQEYISDIAITHSGGVETDQETADDQARPTSRTRSATRRSTVDPDIQKWSLLVASISPTGSGLLLVHQLPIQSDNKLSNKSEYLFPIRRQYLRSPAADARLAFNTSPYPAERHSTLILTLAAASNVKLYQVFPTHGRDRRGSAATSDSISSRGSTHGNNDKGRFLLTFLPPFTNLESTAVLARRKRVLDAQWIAAGRAIIALLEDGEWGIWDLEAVGPTTSTKGSNLLRGQSKVSGIHGGSLTKFAIHSYVTPLEQAKKSSNAQVQSNSGSLAPMTPSTRKRRSEGLFQGTKVAVLPTDSSRSSRGSIYIDHYSFTANGRSHDESVVINFNDESHFIASIMAFWKSDAKPINIPPVRLGGQPLRRLNSLPAAEYGASQGVLGLPTTSIPDFVFQLSHRLVFSVNPLSDPSYDTKETTLNFRQHDPDQDLLDAGDLDVDGMDRILNNMNGNQGSFNKSVAFLDEDDDDEDGDINMGIASPTPTKYSTKRNATFGRTTDSKIRSSNPPGRSRDEELESYERVRPSQPTQRRIFT